ncbi:MAG: spore coat associated protein CotJA [Clostridia bacterium]|nr:spore coat associated protein CotJA [Clostridia bacterium]
MTGRSLAMVYSPCQEFEEIYAPEAGLSRGTIFMKLDKPFLGAGRLK